jgi:hypothetical protein
LITTPFLVEHPFQLLKRICEGEEINALQIALISFHTLIINEIPEEFLPIR